MADSNPWRERLVLFFKGFGMGTADVLRCLHVLADVLAPTVAGIGSTAGLWGGSDDGGLSERGEQIAPADRLG